MKPEKFMTFLMNEKMRALSAPENLQQIIGRTRRTSVR